MVVSAADLILIRRCGVVGLARALFSLVSHQQTPIQLSPLITMAPQYKTGDQVEYRPVGGGDDNVSRSRGEIKDVILDESGQVRYAIQNANTRKTTNYKEMNIVGKIEE